MELSSKLELYFVNDRKLKTEKKKPKVENSLGRGIAGLFSSGDVRSEFGA